MTTYERISRMYEHKEADRVPIMDWAWPETVRRWREEGMPTDDYISYLDLDRTASIFVDNSPRLPETREETEDYVITTTAWGVKNRNYKNRTTTPEHMDFAVKTPDDWKKVKPRMTPCEDRIPWQWLKQNYADWRREGRWIIGELWFGFDITHSGFIGTENMLEQMAEDPDWIRDMFDTELTLDLKLMDRVWEEGYHFDELYWPDDMGYKGTQFFSLKMYREIVKPYHRRAIEWGHAHGCKVRMHSCGNIMNLVPDLAEMGLDGLNPLEVKAGMDPEKRKREYGDRLLFHGGSNAAVWHEPDKVIPEIERLVPMLKENGGYIFASDHSIPSAVSFEQIKRIVDTVKRVGSYD